MVLQSAKLIHISLLCLIINYKKLELMLTRWAKAYSSFGLVV